MFGAILFLNVGELRFSFENAGADFQHCGVARHRRDGQQRRDIVAALEHPLASNLLDDSLGVGLGGAHAQVPQLLNDNILAIFEGDGLQLFHVAMERVLRSFQFVFESGGFFREEVIGLGGSGGILFEILP